jgi:hypothetical protein
MLMRGVALAEKQNYIGKDISKDKCITVISFYRSGSMSSSNVSGWNENDAGWNENDAG